MRAGILGGGIAGLGAAIALRLAGHDVHVFERRHDEGGFGAGVVCWPNAAFVLRELGVEIEPVAGRPRAMRRLDDEGRELGALDLRGLNERLGHPSLSVLRRDLHARLLRRARELGARVHFGREVVGLEQVEPGRARARFADGSACAPELLLGAEGRMRSLARTYVNGSSAPIYQNFVNWIGVYAEEGGLSFAPEVHDYWGVGERFGLVPVSERVAYWAGGAARVDVQPRVPGGELREQLLERFGDWPDPIPAVIEGTPTAALREVYVYDHEPLDTWRRDNVLLIGDAAHAALPTSGQGACQALEDAWHLARSLAESESLAAACAAFEAQRQAKVRGIQVAGRRLAGAIFATDPAACAQRNAEARRTDYDAAVAGMAAFWGSGLPLP